MDQRDNMESEEARLEHVHTHPHTHAHSHRYSTPQVLWECPQMIDDMFDKEQWWFLSSDE